MHTLFQNYHRTINPENIRFEYRVDKANRLTAVLIPGQGRISYNRYQWQMPVHISYPSGTIMTQTVDGLMCLTGRSVNDPAGNPVSAEQWFYDGESNLLKMISREEQANYQYNTLCQLTDAVYEKQPGEFIPEAPSNERYQYDVVGNRTRATVNQAEATSHYNAFNQLIQHGNPHFEYDTNGNLIKRGKRNADNHIAIDPTGTQPYWQYRYDSRERLIEVRKDGNTVARYGYNPMGERTKKELPETGTTIHYLYNEQGLIGEYDDSGQLIQKYGWKPQGLWSTDPLFTRNGAITWQARSDSYGQTTINDKSTLTSNLRLPGQYYDSETGLHYSWFRYYDPNLGRYLRNDPTGLYGGLNAYAYGLNNPLTYIDNNGQLANFALQAVWWGLRQAGAAYIRCFGQCLVASATEVSIGVLWQYMMGDCEPGFEFSEMAILAMQNCGYSCLNPRNWGGKRAKVSTKSKAYENRSHGVGGESPKAEVTRITKGVKEFDTVPYRPTNSPLVNHHGVNDVWAKNNIPGYKSKAADNPTMALSVDGHKAAHRAGNDYLRETMGAVRGQAKNLSSRQMQEMAERQFDAANVPMEARQKFYNEFNRYIY